MCQPLWIYRPRRLRARKWLCKSNEIDWKLFFGQSWPQQIWNTFAIWRRDYYSRRIVAIAILKNSSKYSAERRQCAVDQYDDRMHKGFRVTKAFFCMRVIWVHREFMNIASIQNICYFLWTPEKNILGKKYISDPTNSLVPAAAEHRLPSLKNIVAEHRQWCTFLTISDSFYRFWTKSLSSSSYHSSLVC